MKKKNKTKDYYKLTKHHIIPKSRGGKNLENICNVPGRKHEQYHTLFGNRRPEEIIDYLVKNFWDGKSEYVTKYLNDYKNENY